MTKSLCFTILDLLFCDTYGFPLVRPSLRQTAAWLALWDADVVREVIAREPGLLLAEGDPGSLSEATRASLLRRIIVELAQTGERLGYLPEESLRRFSEAALGPTVRSLWYEHAPIEGCRQLLLRVIGLGVLKDCSDLAAGAASGAYPDDMTQVLAGRALLAIDDKKDLARYATYVRGHASELSGVVRWEAIDRLFARGLAVDDFLKIVSGMDDKARNVTLSLDHYGPHCLERLTKRQDIEAFLQGIEGLIGADEVQDEEEEDRGNDTHLSLLAATALALMARVGPHEVPTNALEIAFRIRHAHRYRTLDEQSRELVAALTATPERRRLAFWYIAEKCAHHRLLHGKPLDSVWAMSFLGWPPGLQASDLEWILADAANKPSIEHAQLAIDAAMEVWKSTGQESTLLQRIETVASRDPVLTGVVKGYLEPRVASAEETEHLQEMARLQSEQAEREAERQSSWTTFIDGLRKSPDQLRKLPAPTKDNVDARLYYLWELLSGMDGQSRYAIEDVRLVEPIVGSELTAAFRDALIGFWRQWEPTLESQRPPDQRNVISTIDCMGLCAVSVESVANAYWPANLTSSLARLAAQFATLELNGFPSWIVKLAALWPTEVSEVVMHEVVAELNQPASASRAGMLQDLEYAALEVAQTVAPALYLDLEQRSNLPSELLAQVLGILSRGLLPTAESFVPFLLSRAKEAPDLEIAALYLATAFHRNPTAAHAALVSKLASLTLAEQSLLVQALFPRLFGDSWRDRDREMPQLPLPVIEDLLRLAFQHIRLEDDVAHEDGKLFQLGPRDSLETARGALFKLLRDTPGPATVVALRRLASNQDMPFAKRGVEQWSFERAAADSENSPWPAGEAFALEQQFDVAPHSPAELQAVAIRRIHDIDYELHHGDSSLGDIFKTLPDENAVQRWIAQELRTRRGRAYTLEREPHVADEKEPDIRLQSTAGPATLPIEIKVAESWGLNELEKGLVDQLCGRYLRLGNAKHGIYLLAYQKLRAIGWPAANGEIYTFAQVVSYLRSIAANLALQGANAPVVQICTIDVSDM